MINVPSVVMAADYLQTQLGVTFFLAVCASLVEEIDTAGVTILRPRCSFESNTFDLNKFTYSDIKMLNVHFTFASGREMSCF